MNPPTLINFDLPSREQILKAIIAAGILANPNTDSKSWGAFSKLSSTGEVNLEWFNRSVDRAYQVLFDEIQEDITNET